MTQRFIKAKPLQACKLAAGLGTLLVTVLAVFNPLPGNGWEILLLAPVIALGLVLVVTAETLVAAYHALRSDIRLTDQLSAQPAYTLVRTSEVAIPLVGTVAFVGWLNTLYIGPNMAGPGAIYLLFVILGGASLILATVLARTLVEYYYHRRSLNDSA